MNYIKLKKKQNYLKINYCFEETNYIMLKKRQKHLKMNRKNAKKARINQITAKL